MLKRRAPLHGDRHYSHTKTGLSRSPNWSIPYHHSAISTLSRTTYCHSEQPCSTSSHAPLPTKLKNLWNKLTHINPRKEATASPDKNRQALSVKSRVGVHGCTWWRSDQQSDLVSIYKKKLPLITISLTRPRIPDWNYQRMKREACCRLFWDRPIAIDPHSTPIKWNKTDSM